MGCVSVKKILLVGDLFVFFISTSMFLATIKLQAICWELGWHVLGKLNTTVHRNENYFREMFASVNDKVHQAMHLRYHISALDMRIRGDILQGILKPMEIYIFACKQHNQSRFKYAYIWDLSHLKSYNICDYEVQ
jgi:hypothetical protein